MMGQNQSEEKSGREEEKQRHKVSGRNRKRSYFMQRDSAENV